MFEKEYLEQLKENTMKRQNIKPYPRVARTRAYNLRDSNDRIAIGHIWIDMVMDILYQYKSVRKLEIIETLQGI